MDIRRIHLAAAACAAAAALAGCETINGGAYRRGVSAEQQAAARAQAERQAQEREQSFMRARVEENAVTIDDISSRIERLERRSGENDAIRGEIDRINERLDALAASQDRLRKEIVDDLSAEIAKAVAAATPRRQPSAPSGRSSGSGYEHVVEAGQTLSQIASAYGTTVEAIKKANDIKDANKVRVGQTLFIPD